MRIRKLMAVPMAALGVLGVPIATLAAAETVALASAPVSRADGCGGGGVPFWGGGGGCDFWTPGGNHIQCGHGFGGGSGGGGCHIMWAGGGELYCDITVKVGPVLVPHANPCPWVD